MRTLDASLLAALESGKFKPYLQLQYAIGDDFEWTDAPYDLVGYVLGGCELHVNTFGTEDRYYAIRLKRGVVISGTPVYVTSSTYFVYDYSVSQKHNQLIRASILPHGNYKKLIYTGAGKTYNQVIDYVCNLFGYTASYEDVGSAPWINTFSVDENLLNLPAPFDLFNLLRQRFLIYAQDNLSNQIYFRSWLDDSFVGTYTHPSLETVTTFDWVKKYQYNVRLFMWLDENKTWYSYPVYAGHEDYPIYDLGFIKNGEGYPTAYRSWHCETDKRIWHLKYQDGDIIHTSCGTYQVMVHEVYNPLENPSLYLKFIALPKLGGFPIDQVPMIEITIPPSSVYNKERHYWIPAPIHKPYIHHK